MARDHTCFWVWQYMSSGPSPASTARPVQGYCGQGNHDADPDELIAAPNYRQAADRGIAQVLFDDEPSALPSGEGLDAVLESMAHTLPVMKERRRTMEYALQVARESAEIARGERQEAVEENERLARLVDAQHEVIENLPRMNRIRVALVAAFAFTWGTVLGAVIG